MATLFALLALAIFPLVWLMGMIKPQWYGMGRKKISLIAFVSIVISLTLFAFTMPKEALTAQSIPAQDAPKTDIQSNDNTPPQTANKTPSSIQSDPQSAKTESSTPDKQDNQALSGQAKMYILTVESLVQSIETLDFDNKEAIDNLVRALTDQQDVAKEFLNTPHHACAFTNGLAMGYYTSVQMKDSEHTKQINKRQYMESRDSCIKTLGHKNTVQEAIKSGS